MATWSSVLIKPLITEWLLLVVQLLLLSVCSLLLLYLLNHFCTLCEFNISWKRIFLSLSQGVTANTALNNVSSPTWLFPTASSLPDMIFYYRYLKSQFVIYFVSFTHDGGFSFAYITRVHFTAFLMFPGRARQLRPVNKAGPPPSDWDVTPQWPLRTTSPCRGISHCEQGFNFWVNQMRTFYPPSSLGLNLARVIQ